MYNDMFWGRQASSIKSRPVFTIPQTSKAGCLTFTQKVIVGNISFFNGCATESTVVNTGFSSQESKASYENRLVRFYLII